MELKDIDFYIGRVEDLCFMFKQSMFIDCLPIPSTQVFIRYIDKIIDDYEKSNHPDFLYYCLDLLNDLYVHNNASLLCDRKQDNLVSIEGLRGNYKDLQRTVYGHTIEYYRKHTNSEKLRIYSDYIDVLHCYLSQRLKDQGIYLREDFTAGIKLEAGVSMDQIKKVVDLLQSLGYIDNDNETSKAFLSLFDGSALAQQKMKIRWKLMTKTGGRVGEVIQNIAALYILFETIGVDLNSASNKKNIENIFLDRGSLKPRNKSKILAEFESQILAVL